MAANSEAKSAPWRSPLSTAITKDKNAPKDTFQHLEKLLASAVSICRLNGTVQCQTGGLITVCEEMQRLLRCSFSEIARLEKEVRRLGADQEQQLTCLKARLTTAEEERENAKRVMKEMMERLKEMAKGKGPDRLSQEKTVATTQALAGDSVADRDESANCDVSGSEGKSQSDDKASCQDGKVMDEVEDLVPGEEEIFFSQKRPTSKKRLSSKKTAEGKKCGKVQSIDRSSCLEQKEQERHEVQDLSVEKEERVVSKNTSFSKNAGQPVGEESLDAVLLFEDTRSGFENKAGKKKLSVSKNSRNSKKTSHDSEKLPAKTRQSEAELNKEGDGDLEKSSTRIKKLETSPGLPRAAVRFPTKSDGKRSLGFEEEELKGIAEPPENDEKTNSPPSTSKPKNSTKSGKLSRKHKKSPEAGQEMPDNTRGEGEGGRRPPNRASRSNPTRLLAPKTIESEKFEDLPADAEESAVSAQEKDETPRPSVGGNSGGNSEDEPLGDMSFLLDVNLKISELVTSTREELELELMTGRQRTDVYKLAALYKLRARIGDKSDKLATLRLSKTPESKMPRNGKVDCLLSELSIAATREADSPKPRAAKRKQTVQPAAGNEDSPANGKRAKTKKKA